MNRFCFEAIKDIIEYGVDLTSVLIKKIFKENLNWRFSKIMDFQHRDLSWDQYKL